MYLNKVIAIGEVLFDQIDENQVIGGAPFNFICHTKIIAEIKKLHLDPVFVSKIGDDDLGKLVLEYCQKIDLKTNFIQIDPKRPTGTVAVNIKDGEPIYDIAQKVAFDFIDFFPKMRQAIAQEANLFYFGTLMQRTAHNRSTLHKMFPEDEFWVDYSFCDLNIRQSFYSKEMIEESILMSDYLKVNIDEFNLLKTEIFKEEKFKTDDELIQFLIKDFLLDGVIITKGANGASLYHHEGNQYHTKTLPEVKIIDTIGAGDAFSAMFCTGLINEWDLETILNLSNQYAQLICQQKGALPADKTTFINNAIKALK